MVSAVVVRAVTPYCVLLCKPTDPDEVIRKAYHVLARLSHPDSVGTGPVAREAWARATDAYNQVKTAELREALAERQALLSGLCAACDGAGVKGTRMFKGKITACSECGGEGRMR